MVIIDWVAGAEDRNVMSSLRGNGPIQLMAPLRPRAGRISGWASKSPSTTPRSAASPGVFRDNCAVRGQIRSLRYSSSADPESRHAASGQFGIGSAGRRDVRRATPTASTPGECVPALMGFFPNPIPIAVSFRAKRHCPGCKAGFRRTTSHSTSSSWFGSRAAPMAAAIASGRRRSSSMMRPAASVVVGMKPTTRPTRMTESHCPEVRERRLDAYEGVVSAAGIRAPFGSPDQRRRARARRR